VARIEETARPSLPAKPRHAETPFVPSKTVGRESPRRVFGKLKAGMAGLLK